jgi:hypothetical protein
MVSRPDTYTHSVKRRTMVGVVGSAVLALLGKYDTPNILMCHIAYSYNTISQPFSGIVYEQSGNAMGRRWRQELASS